MTAAIPMSEIKFNTLHSGDGLFEAPTWDGAGGVYFSNVTAGGVYRYDVATGEISDAYPHRRGIGGLALTESGELVVSGRNVAIREASRQTRVLLEGAALDREVIGFNDLTVSPQGRVVVGALGPGSINPKSIDANAPPPAEGNGTGAFCEIGSDGMRVLADDIGHPNGIAFSPDGRAVYASDTLRRCIWRFTVDDHGWRDRTMFARFDGALTDGMAVAVDGSLWLALALASEIVVLEPDGRERQRIATPVPLTTSVHFGGDDMRIAFITTGSHSGNEAAATLLAMPVDVPGCPVSRARL